MNATEIILARAEIDLCDQLNLSPNVAGRAALIVARSLGSSGWLKDPDAPHTPIPQPDHVAAPAPGIVAAADSAGRDVVEDIEAASLRWFAMDSETRGREAEHIAAELRRLGHLKGTP